MKIESVEGYDLGLPCGNCGHKLFSGWLGFESKKSFTKYLLICESCHRLTSESEFFEGGMILDESALLEKD